MADPIVLDASAWLAVLLREEGSQMLEPLLIERPLLAPDLIFYETANGVVYASRGASSRIKKDSLSLLLDFIFGFPVRKIPIEQWWTHSIGLVQRHALTFYDAAYVACAKSLNIPMLTRDKKIMHVLRAEKLKLVEL